MMRDNVIPLTEIDSLSKEIECLMCLNLVNDSRMCIHCSAIVCVQCIENWLKIQKSCPKCSHTVEQKDFVKCRLANKLVDFIEISKDNCSKVASSQTVSTNDDYKEIMTLNYKLLDFIRKRCKSYEENLATIELTIRMLTNNSNENLKVTDVLLKNPEDSFDAYQKKKQVYTDAIRTDQLLINDMEHRLNESKTLSKQEEILQILQKHIPSKIPLKDN
ncbi:hypothetical protein I4U23_028506 [Adineta vaga]|nr:hypothetical protein I4U23_028506 [Adineta vaga]